MNLKLKAAFQTIGFFVASLVGASLANFLPGYVLIGLVFAGLFFIVYNLLLTRLECEKKLEDIRSKY